MRKRRRMTGLAEVGAYLKDSESSTLRKPSHCPPPTTLHPDANLPSNGRSIAIAIAIAIARIAPTSCGLEGLLATSSGDVRQSPRLPLLK
eukprot:7766828-Alexandrium_andersonii.AAC.1